MREAHERKIRSIYGNWMLGNKKDAAKKVRGLSKLELFYLVSSNLYTALPDFADGEDTRRHRLLFENFIGNALEGLYQ